MAATPQQQRFYRSKAWQKARTACLEAHGFVCERCGRAATIVHHRVYVTPENVDDPSVTLDPDNLECLCRDCHALEHFGVAATAEGLTFDGDGNLIQT